MSNLLKIFYANTLLILCMISETTLILANDSVLHAEKLRSGVVNDGVRGSGLASAVGGGGGRRQNNDKMNPDKLLSQPGDTGMPVFPERSDAVYFIVAVQGGAKAWGNTLARTLLDMGPPFESSQGPPLRPLFVDLPPKGR